MRKIKEKKQLCRNWLGIRIEKDYETTGKKLQRGKNKKRHKRLKDGSELGLILKNTWKEQFRRNRGKH